MTGCMEHTRVMALVAVSGVDVDTDGSTFDYTDGSIALLEHHFVVLNDEGTEVANRVYDGITIKVHTDFDADADGPTTFDLKLSPDQARVLQQMLAQVEVPA